MALNSICAMKKYVSIFAFAAVAAAALVSCSKEIDNQDVVDNGIEMKTITVKTSIAETKTTLDANHENIVWSAGDKISIFNDIDNTNEQVAYVDGGDITVSVPAATTEIYAHYPYYGGNNSGPESVSVYISNQQTQENPGKLNGEYFPMVAKGTVSTDNKALISLYPVASALALNIYHTGLSGEESVKSVTVTPSSTNTGFIGRQTTNITGDNVKYTQAEQSNHIKVTLTNALALGNTKPTNKQAFAGQIYVCLAKQSYSGVTFEIETDKNIYTITSNATAFDLENNDFVPVNINLDKAAKVVAYEESFASDQGLFTIENETLPSALTFVWSHSSNYMKASAYKSGNYEASSRLISPVLTLGVNSELSFSHAANYMTNKENVKNAFLVQIKKVGDASWTDLSLSDESYPDGASWNFADATVALPAAYANQNVQIAFQYTSTSSMAGTWEIRDFKVTNAELLQPKAFSVTTASPIEVPADPTGNSYSIAIEADSDVAWTATLTEGDDTAISLNPTSGTGNGTIALTIDQNTGAARNWKIEVSTSAYVATPSYTIQVVQAKGTTGSTTDVLDRDFTGIEDGATTYSAWSGKTGASGAVYAGQSAGGNDAIQLRSNNSNSGIITTASGGNVKKVTINWNTNTASGRTVSIYGKTSAYTAATELYNSTNQGTLLGELNIDNATSNVSELTVAGNYPYIGIRSKSGALYIDEIEIEWSTEVAATYNITIDPDIEHGSVTASKATGVAEGESVTLTVSPSSGYQLATLTVDGNDVTSSVSNKKYTFSMPAKNINVTATFSLIPTYSITVDPNIEHGTVTPSKSTGIVEGTSITLTVTPDSGYELASLTVGGIDVTSSVSANKYTFEMPGNNVNVTASFAVKTTPGVTAIINFGNNGTKINAASVTGEDSEGNEWTITSAGTTSYTQNTSYSQIGKSSMPATSITFTTTLPTGVSVSSISAAFGGFSGTAGAVALKVGNTTVGTGSLNATTDVTVTSTSTASGNVVTINVTNIAKGVKVYSISVSYK